MTRSHLNYSGAREEKVFEQLSAARNIKGIIIDSSRLTNLRFVDDIVLFADSV